MRKESLIDFQCRQENPNPRVNLSSGTIDLRVWIFLFPFNSIYPSWYLNAGNVVHKSHVMRKPVFAMCEQQGLRDAQADQRLCYSLPR